MRRSALLVLPMTALLAGCGGDDATPAADPASGPQPGAEEVFTGYLVDEGIAVNQEGAEAYLPVADKICQAHDEGASDQDVISVLLTESGDLSGYQVGQLHGAAVAAYCPEYAPS